MNTIYISAILTPVLHTLIATAVTPRHREVTIGAMKLGVLGKIYLMALMLVCIASPISLIALMIFGNASFLTALGYLILGYFSAAALLVLCSNALVGSLLLQNTVAPGIFSANLILSHALAWGLL